MIKDLFEAFRTFTPNQWGMVTTIVCGLFAAWVWVDNRFADRHTTEMILNHLIAIDSKLSAVITTNNSDEQIKKINENAAKIEEQLRKYLELKNKK